MRKKISLPNLMVVVLVVGALGIPASIHSQQTYTVDAACYDSKPLVITAPISEKSLPAPEVVVVRTNVQSAQIQAPQAAASLKKSPDAPFEHFINQAATTHQVDPALIKAIIMAESRYNPKAVSKRGAKGLMQLMPVTAKSLGVEDSFDPEDNINGGVMYFKKLLDRFEGDVELALAAYNAGSRYVRKYGGVPPFRQTRTYIHKVFKYHDQYKQDLEKGDKVI
ncbi:MAG: lytic transglycosylase domain-containing protein [Thermodesulfobacteriota bacterium]